MRPTILRPKLPKPRLSAEGFPAWAFLLLLIANDWMLARQLRSPGSLVAWLALLPDVEITVAPEPHILELLDQFLVSPYFPLLIMAAMAVLWLSGARRGLLVPLMIYLGWATVVSIWSLIVVGVNLFNPTTEADVLLVDTFILWVSNVVVFAAWYWLVDHAGQARYSERAPLRLHFLFPQTGSAMPAWEDWKPGVFDYLFLSFVIMAQLGPSDTIPLTRPAKALVMMQTIIALLSVTLIASRAIGLVK